MYVCVCLLYFFAFLLGYPMLLRLDAQGLTWFPRVFFGWAGPINLFTLKKTTKRKQEKQGKKVHYGFYFRFLWALIKRQQSFAFQFGIAMENYYLTVIPARDVAVSFWQAMKKARWKS